MKNHSSKLNAKNDRDSICDVQVVYGDEDQFYSKKDISLSLLIPDESFHKIQLPIHK